MPLASMRITASDRVILAMPDSMAVVPVEAAVGVSLELPERVGSGDPIHVGDNEQGAKNGHVGDKEQVGHNGQKTKKIKNNKLIQYIFLKYISIFILHKPNQILEAGVSKLF